VNQRSSATNEKEACCFWKSKGAQLPYAPGGNQPHGQPVGAVGRNRTTRRAKERKPTSSTETGLGALAHSSAVRHNQASETNY